MPRRARAKRRKLAASPPSLGAKIVTEDIAGASVCSSPSADLINSQIPLVHVEPLDPSVVQQYASASRSRPSAGEIVDQLIYGDINSTSDKVIEQAFKLIGAFLDYWDKPLENALGWIGNHRGNLYLAENNDERHSDQTKLLNPVEAKYVEVRLGDEADRSDAFQYIEVTKALLSWAVSRTDIRTRYILVAAVTTMSDNLVAKLVKELQKLGLQQPSANMPQ
nr:unnamed protein product [Spirometra erinaceieuropaei]